MPGDGHPSFRLHSGSFGDSLWRAERLRDRQRVPGGLGIVDPEQAGTSLIGEGTRRGASHIAPVHWLTGRCANKPFTRRVVGTTGRTSLSSLRGKKEIK